MDIACERFEILKRTDELGLGDVDAIATVDVGKQVCGRDRRHSKRGAAFCPLDATNRGVDWMPASWIHPPVCPLEAMIRSVVREIF